jgi:hypothetical protein
MRRGHKYNASRTEVDGIFFDSKREAKRYGELKMLQKAGLISDLQLQVKLPISINGQFVFSYVVDFLYWDKEPEVPILTYEDCKGFKTDMYRLKKKCVEAQYRTKIKET